MSIVVTTIREESEAANPAEPAGPAESAGPEELTEPAQLITFARFPRIARFRKFLHQAKLVDFVDGIGFGFYMSRHHLFYSFGLVPIGIVLILVILYGFNQFLTNTLNIKFPGSVLGMLINLVVLTVLSALADVSDGHKNPRMAGVSHWASKVLRFYLRITKPLMNFTLKWMNVVFIPAFVVLPLSSSITFIECLKIAGVFVVGLWALFCVDVYTILAFKRILNASFGMNFDDQLIRNSLSEELLVIENMEEYGGGFSTTMRDDITTIDLTTFKSTRSEPTPAAVHHENPFHSQMPPLRQVVVPEIQEPEKLYLKHSNQTAPPSFVSPIMSTEPSYSWNKETELEADDTQDDTQDSNPDLQLLANTSECCRDIIVFVINYIDWIIYGSLFLVSIPLYYIKSIHTFLPYHLGLTVIAYFLALLVPQKWPQTRKFAHPILILTAEILFVCFIGSLIYHGGKPEGFLLDLKYYKTGKTYKNLFSGKVLLNNGNEDSMPSSDATATPRWPGCGDVLASLMDVSIVSLSLPMFTHRKDFIRNFWILMPALLVSIGLTFFCYPLICYNIGIQAERSIGFIGRSVTLALGTPLINALDGSVSLMSVCTVLSGISSVLTGEILFRLLRVERTDYVTRGISMGVNGGAIATAHLLNVNPRAALMSSLGFSVFGTIMVIMASIGAISDVIKSIVVEIGGKVADFGVDMTVDANTKVVLLPKEGPRFDIVRLPDFGGVRGAAVAAERPYLVNETLMYELREIIGGSGNEIHGRRPVLPKTGEAVKSFIFESKDHGCILLKPNMIVSSRFNLLYFLISIMYKVDTFHRRFFAFEDFIDTLSSTFNDAVWVGQIPATLYKNALANICDTIEENCETFFKYSEEKTLDFVDDKVTRLKQYVEVNPQWELAKTVKKGLYRPLQTGSEAIPAEILELSVFKHCVDMICSGYVSGDIRKRLVEKKGYSWSLLEKYLKQVEREKKEVEVVEANMNSVVNETASNRGRRKETNKKKPKKKEVKKVQIGKGALDGFFQRA